MSISLPERTSTGIDSLTPREIVAELDKYVVGQGRAKRAVAIALRNRLRRQKLPADLAGIHYIEYSLSDVVTARRKLTKELSAWAKVNDLTPIKAEKAKGLRKPRSNAARR